MTANVIVTVEREFEAPRERVFRAWTQPEELAQWRGSPGWHVELDTVSGEQVLGGRHHHVKVRDSDPGTRVGTDGVYTEFFEPDVFVSSEKITGDPGIDPNIPLELRVEFARMGRNNTLVRIIQGPYDPDITDDHSTGWVAELDRLNAWLQANATPIEGAGR